MGARATNIQRWHDTIHHGDNLPLLEKMPSESVALIYIDPPFNTGKRQSRTRIKTTAVANGGGDRRGFGGREYATRIVGESGYADSFDDYMAFLRPRLEHAHRILTPNGSLFFHIDWREAANCRLLLEEIFGGGDRRKGGEHCINEIIWAYDYGARSKSKWSAKHDNIYWFAKNPNDYIFNYDAIDRIPYMAADLAGEEKAKRGKTPTDVWWNTIVPTNSGEKEAYPTQKPLAIMERIVKTHSNFNDTVLDFFAGSGTTGAAAKNLHRHYVLMDESKSAYDVMLRRLKKSEGVESVFMEGMVKQFDKESRRTQKLEWKESPFQWMLALPSATKGKIGKELACHFLFHQLKLEVDETGRDVLVNNKRVAIKFSLLWDTGVYKFEQIKKKGSKGHYDYFFLLGVSPSTVHAWVVSGDAYDEFPRQHNVASRWLEINPQKEATLPPYLKNAGGELKNLSAKHFQ